MFPCIAIESSWPCFLPQPFCRWSAAPTAVAVDRRRPRPDRFTPPLRVIPAQPPPARRRSSSGIKSCHVGRPSQAVRSPTGRPGKAVLPALFPTLRYPPHRPLQSGSPARPRLPCPVRDTILHQTTRWRCSDVRMQHWPSQGRSCMVMIHPHVVPRRGNRMFRRNLLARLDRCWSSLCVWFINRSPLSPAQSLRLLRLIATVLHLPIPCPVIARR